jgi:hypothetical protein
MVDGRPYPSRILTKEEEEERQKHIDKEHYDLQEKWHEKGLQPVFDVGRLASPMWQKYRHLFKEQIKAGVKGKGRKKRAFTQWECKWLRPEAFKLSKTKFLNLKTKVIHLEHDDAYGNYVGFSGTYSDVSFALMKADMARIKHGSKVNLTEFQKNMALIPANLSAEAYKKDNEIDFSKMREIWLKYGKGKKPWDYNRVFLQGSVWGKKHSILIVLTFSDPDEPDTLRILDSAHEQYKRMSQHLLDWLAIEGYDNAEDEIGVEYHDKDIPLQRDPFNCGQYMLVTASYLMRWEKPKYSGCDAPDDEPFYWDLIDPKYMWGRTDENGNRVHQGLDTVVQNFAEKKIKDYDRLKKVAIKQFKGFK